MPYQKREWMPDEARTYSQKLKPKQIQTVFDALSIPWREYEPNPDGWVQVDAIHFHNAVSAAGYDHMYMDKPAFNLKHGGYVDHFVNGMLKAEDYDFDTDVAEVKKAVKGDVVDLVRRFHFGVNQSEDATALAIKWIQSKIGTAAPELKPGQKFAKNAIADNDENYVMIPNSLWQNKDLSASAKLVWIAIFERCGKGRHYSFPGMEKIAKDTGLSRSTVQLKIEELKRNGFLIEIPKGEGKAPRRYPIVKPVTET
jgi:hypothetical protein